MKVKLSIGKGAKALYSGEYDIIDADSFGEACADMWRKLEQAPLNADPNIGAVMEHMGEGVAGQLDGLALTIQRL